MTQHKILELTLGKMVTHSEKRDDSNDERLVTYHIQENKQVHDILWIIESIIESSFLAGER